ncbi:hypothetical protein ABB37_01665 [Leptomonas pyrrhocoris]|uniref:Uncharacterized protein n=1 Tax=Leptomonas pyrrhocoris TaxID=157538 RepID=A0A0M9G9G8_LEPPY|nr:hypothetical protein ABB37_01665 [Leptomonas pyrrhocoris]KPA85339.1 hypothetical protein ABB37_01665 [Leptomonas pyrrhocoris]|eukprot:XP_015663778.1 hypothetical protein ABB37_01665 [Leptomonas pyrrhocoris]
MRGWLRPTDRAAVLGLPVVAQTSSKRTSTREPFSAAVLTFSELAGADVVGEMGRVTTSQRAEFEVDAVEEEENLQYSIPPSATGVVDVDAEGDRETGALQVASSHRSRWTHDGTTASMLTPAVHRHLVRDSVVLSYRDNCCDGLQTAAWATLEGVLSAPEKADELLAIAVDESHIFLRRGGRVGTQASSPRSTYSSMPSLCVWKTELAEGQSEGVRQSANPHTSATQQADELSSANRSSALPVYSTQWKQEASILLPHAQNQLFRVRPRNGAQSSIVFSGLPGDGASTSDRCQAGFVALSSAAVSLVHARDEGAELTPLEHVSFDGEVAVNATCMDDWGPHSLVVCFSDGTLRVVDWRMPCASASPLSSPSYAEAPGSRGAQTNFCMTRAPQPRWLGTRQRNSLAFTSVAGILSCCALEDSFRVVCGLGDASGAVVVADLRKPDAPVAQKRGRRSTVDMQKGRLFSDVGGHAPTGRAITEICRDAQHFGRVGVVDLAGTAVVTHISVLEDTGEALIADGRPLQGRQRVDNELSRSRESARSLGPSFNPSRRGARLPSPPSPWQILSRAERTATSSALSLNSTSPTTRMLAGRTDTPVQPLLGRSGFCPRCTFTSDGSYFVHTEAGSRMSATLRCLSSTTGSHGSRPSGASSRTTHLRFAPAVSHNPAALSTSFVAVSSVDRLVCFDTSDGNTLSILLK